MYLFLIEVHDDGIKAYNPSSGVRLEEYKIEITKLDKSEVKDKNLLSCYGIFKLLMKFIKGDICRRKKSMN